MNAVDFQYDDLYLSDFGCIICSFDSGGSTETISMGSEISFTKSAVSNGRRYMITDARYDDCIETEFCICKDPDLVNDYEDRFFTLEEQRDIMRWLNRTEMCRFTIVNDEFIDIFYEGSFNVDKIELNGNVIGMNLRFTSNRPFALGLDLVYSFRISVIGNSYTIQDSSDEIGYVYPDFVVTLLSGGDLTITNSFDGRQTVINNCVSGEKITMKNMVIETSNSTHAKTIMNDFNFKFPQICNSYNNAKNTYTFSLPCTVSVTYRPVRKVGI
ncbi:MAG: hypothetical protein IKO36_08520 [Bacteroidaceae bacterium]|nr:hypothetical protein [Bacteroidaceae bacterium]